MAPLSRRLGPVADAEGVPRLAAEREVVMTEGAIRQQGFAGRNRGFPRLAVLFRQGQETKAN
jgi:hypothetical protein